MDFLVVLYFMVTDLKKIISIILLGLLTSCKQSPEDFFISHLKRNYSNLYINGESKKRSAIAEIDQYLSNHPLNDQNIDEINILLNKVKDGHVVIKDSRDEKNIFYNSGIKFVKGSNYIESCATCKPALAAGRYSVVGVDEHSLKDFLNQYSKYVSASSPWGQEYKVYRLIESSHSPQLKTITLQDEKLKKHKVELSWQKINLKEQKCIDKELGAEGIVHLRIHTLWCNYGDNKLSRAEIIHNFKNELEAALSEVRESDSIVLDLRENGGGGDAEVELILNTFIKDPVQMYKYQYLKTTVEGRKNRLTNLFTRDKSIWAKVEYQVTNPSHKTKYQLYNNKLILLTSPGCFSSCEGLASILKYQKRAILVGTKTHGGAGAPIDYSIKGTPYSLSLPSCLTWQNNDLLYEGVGVIPDIEIHQSATKFEDMLLSKAIDLVR